MQEIFLIFLFFFVIDSSLCWNKHGLIGCSLLSYKYVDTAEHKHNLIYSSTSMIGIHDCFFAIFMCYKS